MSNTKQEDSPNVIDELDVGSDKFNSLRALYAADFKVTDKSPKVLYQNLAAFESALLKVGVWQLNKRPKSNDPPNATQLKKNPNSSPSTVLTASEQRFKGYQMPIEGTPKLKYQRNLFTQMANTEGPLTCLRKYLHDQGKQSLMRIRVYLRKKDAIGGNITGDLVAFDKQWNLLLMNTVEVWQRRKYNYGNQNICGKAISQDCLKQFQKLGITLPAVVTKSISRKNIELRREVPQLMVRGENIALITFISKSTE